MKSSRLYIIGIVVMIIVCFVLGQRMPRNFTWRATFHPNDRQPLGCYVFDSVMAQTMPRGYEAKRKTLSQIAADTADRHKNILIATEYLSFNEMDIRALRKLLKGGCHVMMAYCDTQDGCYSDSILAYDYGLYAYNFTYLNIRYLKMRLRNKEENAYATVSWDADSLYRQGDYRMYTDMMSGTVITDDSRKDKFCYDVLAQRTIRTNLRYDNSPFFPATLDTIKKRLLEENKDMKEVTAVDCYDGFRLTEKDSADVCLNLAVTRKVGKGRLTIVTMPYLFTNYGVLAKESSPLTMRLMTQISDRPVIRTTSYSPDYDGYDAKMSPMRYVLSQKPLREAWYLTAFTLLLFFIFKARRRQRVIPVMTQPKNHSLEFAQLIGTLYYQRADNADLVRKKTRFFAERIRSTMAVDILENVLSDDTVSTVARRTGMKEKELEDILKRLRMDYCTEGNIDDKEMKWAIDTINALTERI